MRERRSFDNKQNGLRYADDTQATNNQKKMRHSNDKNTTKRKNLKIARFFFLP